MVDISTVSIVIASAGVLVAATYYVLQIRHQSRMRQTDVFWRIFQSFNTKEFLEAWFKIFNLEFKDYDEFVEKYGQPFSEGSVPTALFMVGNLFEGAGILLNKRLVDFDLIYRTLPVYPTWKKMKPIVDGARKQYQMPSLLEWFEYLYNEMKRREQKGVKNG